jgi:hypothetical protein
MEFPSNSKEPIRPSTGATPKPPEKIEKQTILKVVDDGVEVIRKKRTIGDRFKDMFLKDGKERFERYMIDVLFPSAQDMLFEAGAQMLARAILGEERAKHVSSSTVRTVTSRLVGNSPRHVEDYGRYSKPVLSRAARTHHDFEQIVLPTHRHAMKVITAMQEAVERYGTVTVGDMYDMLGEESTFADEKYGWTTGELDDARPRQVRNGFLLDMNKPQPLRIR